MKTMKRILAFTLALATLLTLMVVPASAATLKIGSKSTQVKYVHLNLAFLGYDPGLAATRYTQQTADAVCEFQEDHNLDPDSIAGPLTLGALWNEVIRWQMILRELGYYSGTLDGIAGSGTCTALKYFQRDYGLNPTGLLNARTERTLWRTYLRMLEDSDDEIDRFKAEAISQWTLPLKDSFAAVIDHRQFGTWRSGGRIHAGIDFVAPAGTPVYACQSGTVILVNKFYEGTYEVVVQHDDASIIRYGEVRSLVSVGDYVEQGDQIAAIMQASGGTEMLHLECYYGTESSLILSQTWNRSYSYVPAANYQRRADLLDPMFLMLCEVWD